MYCFVRGSGTFGDTDYCAKWLKSVELDLRLVLVKVGRNSRSLRSQMESSQSLPFLVTSNFTSPGRVDWQSDLSPFIGL